MEAVDILHIRLREVNEDDGEEEMTFPTVLSHKTQPQARILRWRVSAGSTLALRTELLSQIKSMITLLKTAAQRRVSRSVRAGIRRLLSESNELSGRLLNAQRQSKIEKRE